MTERLSCRPGARRAPAARKTTLAALAALSAVLVLPLPAAAQKSLGGGKGSGPVMTREELRTCLKQKETLNAQVAAYEAEREALATEKTALIEAKKQIDQETGGVEDGAAKVNAINKRTADLAARVDDWNARWSEFEKEKKSGPFADRQRRKLKDEQRGLQAEQEAIDKDRAALGDVSGSSDEVNAKVQALNARTVAWNDRNGKIAKMADDVAQARDLWTGECGNRRFREDDEIAIRNGQ